jgi:transcriptional regulator with XRE-family HTH domain
VWTECCRRAILVEMGATRDRSLVARQIFARQMKRLRLRKELSQEKLAAKAGLHPNYIGSVERAERNISLDNMERIAKALAVPVAQLLHAKGTKG